MGRAPQTERLHASQGRLTERTARRPQAKRPPRLGLSYTWGAAPPARSLETFSARRRAASRGRSCEWWAPMVTRSSWWASQAAAS